MDYANLKVCPFTEFMRSNEATNFYNKDLGIAEMYVLIRKFQKSYSYGLKPKTLSKPNPEKIYLVVSSSGEKNREQPSSFEYNSADFFEKILGRLTSIEKNENLVFEKGKVKTKVPIPENAKVRTVDLKSFNKSLYLPTFKFQKPNDHLLDDFVYFSPISETTKSDGMMLKLFDNKNNILILQNPVLTDTYYIMQNNGAEKTTEPDVKMKYDSGTGKDLTYFNGKNMYTLYQFVSMENDQIYNHKLDIIEQILKNGKNVLQNENDEIAAAYSKKLLDRKQRKSYFTENYPRLKKLQTNLYNYEKNAKLRKLKEYLMQRFINDDKYKGSDEKKIGKQLDTLLTDFENGIFTEQQREALLEQKFYKNYHDAKTHEERNPFQEAVQKKKDKKFKKDKAQQLKDKYFRDEETQIQNILKQMSAQQLHRKKKSLQELRLEHLKILCFFL